MTKEKFNVVIKADTERFIKWRGVDNFDAMISYLNKNYPRWRWFNYYSRQKPYSQLGSYSRTKGYL